MRTLNTIPLNNLKCLAASLMHPGHQKAANIALKARLATNSVIKQVLDDDPGEF